jgi:hypothetical protein
MFRRHWLTLLIGAAVAYFGLAAAPVLAQLDRAEIVATR